MKRLFILKPLFALTPAFCLVLTFGVLADSDEALIFKAMQDELQRSMSDLLMNDLERPYFISYTIDDFNELRLTGSLGTLTRSQQRPIRYLTVELRVGDTTLDNSNFVEGYYRRGPTYRTIAIQNDYDAIRHQVYLLTDRAYKDALRILSKKHAYLQTRVIKNRPNDFLMQPAHRFFDQTEPSDIDRTFFEDLVRSASAVFRDYPTIISSELRLSAAVVNQYYVNSGGSQSLRGDRSYVFRLHLSGKSHEGEDVHFSDRIIVNDLADVPGKDELVEWAEENAERMRAMLVAETIEEYAGPVILTGDAAGEFFRQLFAKNAANCPFPLYESEETANRYEPPAFG
ncbi:MAG: hypothetical protein JSV44_04280, partial [Candidatus Zixiibacteriota bacterium]